MEEPMEIEFSSDNDDDLIMEVDKIEKNDTNVEFS